MVKVRVLMRLPVGPVTLVLGGWSLVPNVSNFFVAFDGSWLPVPETARALIVSSRLLGNVSGRDQVVEAAPGCARTASKVLTVVLPQVVRSSLR